MIPSTGYEPNRAAVGNLANAATVNHRGSQEIYDVPRAAVPSEMAPLGGTGGTRAHPYEVPRAAIPSELVPLGGTRVPAPSGGAICGTRVLAAQGSSDTSITPFDAIYSIPVPEEDSPQRRHLRGEVHQWEATASGWQMRADEIRYEARDALQSQRAGFERAAQEHEQMARDINAAELAQANAMMQSHSQSMLQNTVNQAEQKVAQEREGARKKLAYQQASMASAAGQAIENTKLQVVGEARQALDQQQAAFSQQYNNLYREAENDYLQERARAETLQSDVHVQEQRAGDLQREAHVQALQASEASQAMQTLATQNQQMARDIEMLRQQIAAPRPMEVDNVGRESMQYQLTQQRELFRNEFEEMRRQLRDQAGQHHTQERALENEIEDLQGQVSDLSIARRRLPSAAASSNEANALPITDGQNNETLPAPGEDQSGGIQEHQLSSFRMISAPNRVMQTRFAMNGTRSRSPEVIDTPITDDENPFLQCHPE